MNITIDEDRQHLNLRTSDINDHFNLFKLGTTGYSPNKIAYEDWNLMEAIQNAKKDNEKENQLLQKAENTQLDDGEIDILAMYTINRYMNALDSNAYETIYQSTDMLLYDDMMRLIRKLIDRIGIARNDRAGIYGNKYDEKFKKLVAKLG